MAKKQQHATGIPAKKRSYLKQSDVPMTTLDEALRVPQAILDHYAGKPSSPLFFLFAIFVGCYERGIVNKDTPVIWEWLAFLFSIIWVLAQSIVLGKKDALK